MAGLRIIGYQVRLPPSKVDELLSELAAQTEHWITAENAPPSKRKHLNYGNFTCTDPSLICRTCNWRIDGQLDSARTRDVADFRFCLCSGSTANTLRSHRAYCSGRRFLWAGRLFGNKRISRSSQDSCPGARQFGRTTALEGIGTSHRRQLPYSLGRGFAVTGSCANHNRCILR